MTAFKLARKNAFVALANLGDNFEKMLSEPAYKSGKTAYYHQFVSTSHTLTSYIASLSYYAQRAGNKYQNEAFEPLIENICEYFLQAIHITEKKIILHG